MTKKKETIAVPMILGTTSAGRDDEDSFNVWRMILDFSHSLRENGGPYDTAQRDARRRGAAREDENSCL